MYRNAQTNFEKYPSTRIHGYDGGAFGGYEEICALLRRRSAGKPRHVICVDCNSAVHADILCRELSERLHPDRMIFSDRMFLPDDVVQEKLKRHVTDDRVFGVLYRGAWDDFIDAGAHGQLCREIENAGGLVLVIGIAASRLVQADTLIYADMTIWETQMRYRAGDRNFAANNAGEDYIRKFKRGYFVDWRLDNRHKQEILERMDFYLDTVDDARPAMVTREAFEHGLQQLLCQPFRTVPFFDDGLWGGQWMREVCGLEDSSKLNFAWSYNLLFQENEVNLTYGDVSVNVPGYTVCLRYPRELIGEKGYSRFGAEYPIRYDFLDTMQGGNLSLQVHPTTQYIQEHFGMTYTQDESYYYLDCAEDCCIYLGLKNGVDKAEMSRALYVAQSGEAPFDDTAYVNRFPVKKHQHFHIPAGTVHASGANGMVLEISSSPCIFTFKLWDWGRVGMDGIPRPIHLEHGLANIQFNRKTDWILETCAFDPVPVREGEGFREEKTGLHDLEFIETRRIWATGPYLETTGNETHALNLVEGEEAVIESPDGQFEPFTVHYAESVVIPAGVSSYTVRPAGRSEGKQIGVVKSFVRY